MQDHEGQESRVLSWGERKKHFGSQKCSNKNSRIYAFRKFSQIFSQGFEENDRIRRNELESSVDSF